MTDTNVAGKPSNAPKFSDLEKMATDLGSQVGQGKDSFAKLLLKVHEAAFLGSLDVDQNKHGQGVDDAQKLTAAYVSGQNASVIFDAKAPNQRVTTSKVRTLVRLGMWPKGGQGEPLAMVNSFMTLRQQLRKDPAHCKKLLDPSDALIRLARTQLKRDQLVTASEFKSFLFKPEADVVTEEDWLTATRKKAQNGKAGKGSLAIDATTADSIINACTKRLKDIVKARAPAAAAAAFGIVS